MWGLSGHQLPVVPRCMSSPVSQGLRCWHKVPHCLYIGQSSAELPGRLCLTGLWGFQDFYGAVTRALDETDQEGKDVPAREELRRGLSELPPIRDLHQGILEELEERLLHW